MNIVHSCAKGDRFQKEFTDGEKIKLYKAIGYDEKSKDLTYPDQVRCSSELKMVKNNTNLRGKTHIQVE